MKMICPYRDECERKLSLPLGAYHCSGVHEYTPSCHMRCGGKISCVKYLDLKYYMKEVLEKDNEK